MSLAIASSNAPSFRNHSPHISIQCPVIKTLAIMHKKNVVFTTSYIKRGGTGFIIHSHAVCKLIVNSKPWEAYPVRNEKYILQDAVKYERNCGLSGVEQGSLAIHSQELTK